MEGEVFDWKKYLNSGNFEAVDVSCVQHAPLAQIWSGCVKEGMKVIVKHQDIPVNPSSRRKHAFWVASVVKIRGYFCQIRYEGMKESTSDFWIHLGKHEVHPVGADLKNLVLIPPKSLDFQAPDWRTYFLKHLPDAMTLPIDFYQMLRKAISCSKYRVGDHLEVLDKYKISQLRVARVSKIIGRRMYLRYLDDYNDGFFCHEQSSLIHSVGWADCVGHKLQAPPDFYLTSASTSTSKTLSSSPCPAPNNSLREGMKLEAVDPLCPSRICAATICKVLQFGYMMIKVDSYDETSNTNGEDNDWFCYNLNSPYIFECGFCHSNGISITPPFGLNPKSFSWATYLKETNSTAAPVPPKPNINHGFEVGMKLEMVDLMTPTKIHVATIVKIAGRLLRINFDGWEPMYDQWLDAESPDIYPMGWCALVGHQLDGPKLK